MKTIKYWFVLLLFIGLSSSGLMAQPLSGTYTVGTGSGDNFASLHAAVTALNTEGMSGDVQLLITTDLDEGQNIFLGLDTDGHTLTIRPAAGTTPTITFTATATNSAINGALVIGANSDDWDSLVETRNVIIDGSNTVGGTSRDLSITTLSTTGTSNFVRILGNARDVTIRNATITMNQPAFDTILISPLNRDETDWVPQNIVIANNFIKSRATRTSSRAINVWQVTGTGFGAIGTTLGSIHITDNEIEARRYGIWLRLGAGHTTISGNQITIDEAGTFHAYGILVDGVQSPDVEVTIRGNQLKGSSSDDLTMIDLNATANYTIEKNTISNFVAGAEAIGVNVQQPADAIIRDNQVAGSAGTDFTAFDLNATANYTIERNTIADIVAGGFARGVHIQQPADVTIRSNLFKNFKGDTGIEMITNVASIGGGVTMNIINNRLTGFSSDSESGRNLFGIQLRSTSSGRLNATLQHNTVVLNPITIEGTGWDYRALTVFSNSRIDLTMRNNIFINNDDNGTAVLSYAYYQAGSAAANLDSDFNIFGGANLEADDNTWLTRHGAVGTNTTELSAFQTQSSGDANSRQLTPEFDADLRLTGASNGSADLLGTPLASVTTDAFGTVRSTTAPTMGAFESSRNAPSLIVSGDAGWRMMASPVTNFTVAQFAEQTAIQGVAGLPNSAFPANIYTGYDGTQWTAPTSGEQVLASGRGFITLFFDNDQAGSQSLPVTLTAPGASPLTEVTVTGLHNDGDRWNLLGNPFPWPVDMESITANGGISAHGQVWVDGEGVASGGGTVNGSWIPTTAAPFNNQIAPWQGVMMQTTEESPATQVVFPAASMDENSTLAFQRQLPSRTIQFRLRGEDSYQGMMVEHPATMLYMHPEATEGSDRHDLDLLAPLGNGTVLLYWVARENDTNHLRIQNGIPYQVTETMLFDLDVFSYGPEGSFTLDWPHITGFSDEGYTFMLTDNQTGARIDLMAGESYTFTLARDEQAPASPWEVTSGQTPRFTLRIAPATGTSTESGIDQPLTVSLDQNFPNPFNPSTTISYTIAEAGLVTLTVYDVTGRRVATLVNQEMSPGQHTATFNAATLSSGLYIYRLQTGGTQLTRSMTLIK